MTVNKSKLIVLTILCLSWLPATGIVQAASYLAPIIIVSLMILMRQALIKKIVIALVFFLLLTLVSLVFNFEEISPSNYLIATITHLSIILFAFKINKAKRLDAYLTSCIASISIVQLLIGTVQLVMSTGGTLQFSYAGSGDFVTGTLLDNSHLYVVKMLVASLYLACVIFRGDRRLHVLTGLIASLLGAILGSALLTMSIFFASTLIFFIFAPSFYFRGYSLYKVARAKLAVIAGFFLCLMVFSIIQEQNVKLIASYANTAIESLSGERNYGLNKIIAARNIFSEQFSQPEKTLFGYGFGHYSSRAALIASDEYLRHQPQFIPVYTSPTMQAYLIPYWNRSTWSIQFQDGVMNQPFFSVQSLIVETGLIGFMFVAIIFILSIRHIAKTIKNGEGEVAYALLAIVCVSPLLLLTDNWIEYPSLMLQVAAVVIVFNAHNKSSLKEEYI